MNAPNATHGLYLICQHGAEAALKREVSRAYPDLRFGFSRPGFVTYKSERDLAADFAPELVLARAFGLTLGKTRDANLESAARIEFARALELAGPSTGSPRLHVWERDFFEPDQPTPAGFDPLRAPREIEQELRKALAFAEGPPAAGDLVFDVIRVEGAGIGGKDSDEIWFGYHRHTPLHPPFAGGRFTLPLPERAPSRAYLKLEEATALFQVPLRSGETAVEIGSAPGGASFALVERGLRVVGIDPAAMEASFTARSGERFTHLRKPVASVGRDELPPRFEWLLMDMNVDPDTAFGTLDAWLPELVAPGGSLQGAVLTLKLNDWRLADRIPQYLERLRAMGLVRLRARQLSSNKRELSVFGLTREGLKRAAGART